jgi:hypothetical protein
MKIVMEVVQLALNLKLILKFTFINVLLQKHKLKTATFAETKDFEMIEAHRKVVDVVLQGIDEIKRKILQVLLQTLIEFRRYRGGSEAILHQIEYLLSDLEKITVEEFLHIIRSLPRSSLRTFKQELLDLISIDGNDTSNWSTSSAASTTTTDAVADISNITGIE